MPWYFPWSDSIKKRASRYLLQHYLGRFLETKLGLDQLSVDLYNGTGSVTDVSLDVDSLNELGEELGFPVTFLDGGIEKVSVTIPWSALLNESSFVEIQGLCLVVQPKEECKNSFMLESMINSMTMTSSMQLAQECLKQNEDDVQDSSQPTSYEGLELFAKALDTVLARVKVRFLDTIVRVEHIPTNSAIGVGLEIQIKKIDYFDLAGLDQSSPKASAENEVLEKAAFATKKFNFEGLSLWTDEFPGAEKTMSRSCSSSTSSTSPDNSGHSTFPAAEDRSRTSCLVQCAKFSGRHEVSVKLKQSENVTGPKVELDLQFGPVVSFISPRQFHACMAIFESLFPAPTPNNRRTKRAEKPMQESDYRRIESELQHQLKQKATVGGFIQGDSLNRKGWSTEDSDDEFHPFSAVDANSPVASSPTGVDHLSESPLSYGNLRGPRKLSNRSNSFSIDDTEQSKLRFTFRLASVVAVLLQENVFAVNSTTSTLASSTVVEMRNMAEAFFAQIGLLSLSGGSPKDFAATRQKINSACSKSHIRFVAAPITGSGWQQTSAAGSDLEVIVTVAAAEVLECLREKSSSECEISPLLTFEPAAEGAVVKPNIVVKVTAHEPSTGPQKLRNPIKHELRVNVQLSPCECEVDMSIADRITALITRPAFLVPPPARPMFGNMYQDKKVSVDDVLSSESKCHTYLTITSSRLQAKLRFPVPDLRPVHDVQRTPWWRRCIRPDILTLDLTDATIATTLIPGEVVQTYELVSKGIKAYYQENPMETAILFLNASAQEGDSVNMAEGAGNFDLPRLVITLRPAQSKSQLEEDENNTEEDDNDPADVMMMSTGEALLGLAVNQPSPFSRRRLVHKGQNNQNGDMEELLVPGSPQEISEFCTHASRGCLRKIDISLPKVQLLLPTKHFYEVLYNRLSTDLALWEPSAPEYCATGTNFDLSKQSFVGLNSAMLHSPVQGMFSMCKSGIRYDSESESDENDSGDFSYLRNRRVRAPSRNPSKDSPSKLCLTLNIGSGSCSLFTLIRDSTGTASVTHHGELQCSIEEGTLFVVTGYNGDSNSGYVCLQASRANVSHNGCIFNAFGEVLGGGIPHNSRLDPVIYPATKESVASEMEPGPMLAVAVNINIDERSRVKTFRTAVALKNGTLRHRFCPAPNSWFTQLTDFFDVVDYPIAGYRPPTVVTELHLNLSNCVVDYRPLYLPARVLLTLGTFNVSSNIIAQTNCSVLRFVVEDAALHLSNRVSFATVNLQKNYVCVVDVDLLELTLRLQTGDGKLVQKIPTVDLQAAINLVQLRTCADSCRLLLDLLTYIAEDGDLDEKGAAFSEASSESGNTIRGNEYSSMETEEAAAQVNDLMAEAMQESSPRSSLGEDVHKIHSVRTARQEETCSPTEVFFFPDEGQKNGTDTRNPQLGDGAEEPGSGEPRGVWNPSVGLNLMSEAIDDVFNHEEEFCILENDPGVGFTPRTGEPETRRLDLAPIQIVEGHFAPPVGKVDVMKAPKHFPVPVMSYTLQEMNVIWHMYGGHDFPAKESATASPRRNNHQPVVSFSKSENRKEEARISYNQKTRSYSPLPASQRYALGGQGRSQDVKLELQLNKVRFQHEVYPETTTEASRQVLVIADIEIRDRLAASQINKLLYQYATEARPRQAHANMVLVKALHVRPDPRMNAQECNLKVSILPLRLHVDQDTLFFITEFFTALASSSNYIGEDEDPVHSRNTSNGFPVMGVGGEPLVISQPPSLSRNNSDVLIQDLSSNSDTESLSGSAGAAPPVYFRSFTFSPEVLIRFDYHGKHVDLSQGPLAGILVGLGQLNCSQITLKRLSYRHGLLGVNKLLAYVLNEWLMDIKKNQLPSLLGGVGPMHSIVQLFQGIRDLFWLPIEQFQKDGRIVRGLQRGASAFSTSAALALLELTSRFIQTLQSAAETAYDVVSPGPSVKRHRPWSRGRRRRHAQPADIRDGVAKAYQVVREGLGETAQTLVRVASEEAEQKGVTGAVGGVLRQIPPSVVKPIILATEATVNVIGGVQSQLMPGSRKEAMDKWRQDEER